MKYTGGCHCGDVRYEVEMELDSLIECNCSICSKKGYLLAFAPEEKLTVISGDDVLTDYQFGHKMIHHLFCNRCGVASFGRGSMPDGTKMCAVNARCLDDVDLAAIPRHAYDGKSL